MTGKKEKAFEFALLENGLDFIASAIGHLHGDPSKNKLKYAVLHLSSGVELVLKERLHREHWTLVFEHPDKVDKKAYGSGEFESVKFESCVKRLEGACGIAMPDNDLVRLKRLREKRNRLEHFGIVDSHEAVVASSVSVLEIVLRFITEHIEPEALDGESAGLMKDIRRGLGELKAFVAERWKVIKSKVEEQQAKKVTLVACPHCLQETLVLDGRAECLFCGYSAEGQDAADEYVSEVLGLSWGQVMGDGGEWPVSKCPECDLEALVDLGPSGSQYPQIQYICFNCGEQWEEGSFSTCSSCGALYDRGEDGIAICDDCFDGRVRKDD